MPPEIDALLDKPLWLALILALGAVIGIVVERFAEGQKRAERSAYWKGRNASGGGTKRFGGFSPFKAAPLKGTPERASLDAAEQLRSVMEAKFTARTVLNLSERRLLSHFDRALGELAPPGWRMFAQVSLGEILASPDAAAFGAINSKRVDLLIVDADCRPRAAVEFQGTGHYQGTAAARDAVKKEALRRAGIRYGEVVTGDTPADVRAMVQKLVKQIADERGGAEPKT